MISQTVQQIDQTIEQLQKTRAQLLLLSDCKVAAGSDDHNPEHYPAALIGSCNRLLKRWEVKGQFRDRCEYYFEAGGRWIVAKFADDPNTTYRIRSSEPILPKPC